MNPCEAVTAEALVPDVADGPSFSTSEAVALADSTMRQTDYLVRVGALTPACPGQGSGFHRRWSVLDVAALVVAARLRRLGASSPVIRAALADLRDHPALWDGRIAVSTAGARTVSCLDDLSEGWLIDAAACWAVVAQAATVAA